MSGLQRRILVLGSVLFVLAPPLPAQPFPVLVDTLTAGRSACRNPVVPHDIQELWGGAPFAVFERDDDGQSQIAAIMFSPDRSGWLREPVIIAATDESEPQRRPDCSQYSFSRLDSAGVWEQITVSAVVWERFAGGRWSVWCALQTGRQGRWSDPRPLAEDLSRPPSPQVRAMPETENFVVAWKADTALIGLEVSADGSVSGAETLAVSNFAEFDYHTHSIPYWADPGPLDFVWTVRDSSGSHLAVYRYRKSPWAGGGLSEPDTVRFDRLRRATVASAAGFRYLLAEQACDASGCDIFISQGNWGTGWDNISGDPTAINTHPSTYTSLLITKPGATVRPDASYWIDVLAFERVNRHVEPADSGIVMRWYGLADTIRSGGYDRRPCVGGVPFYHTGLRRWVIPVVWESDRTGRPQIYGTLLEILYDDVTSGPPLPAGPALRANYPNPFNPSTTVEYELPSAGPVTLSVYSILGEELERIVDAVQSAGIHRAVWDGSGHASGVYVCRLTAGRTARSIRMMLLR